MSQWQAAWCTGSAPITLAATYDSEEQGRNDFLSDAGSAGARVDMALTTMPASGQQSSRKYTYAPLANSGTDIAYYIDDASTGAQIQRMVLNPDLLAKLFTQSYSLDYESCSTSDAPSVTCDPAVYGNPQSVFDDPEFLSLNQNCQPYGQLASYVCGEHAAQDGQGAYSDFPSDGADDDVIYGGFLPTILAADSDMTYDLTGWIASNKDAESFLAGKQESDGSTTMRVNNNYMGVSYPTSLLSAEDDGYTLPLGSKAVTCSNGVCDIGVTDESMQTSWNFVTGLDTITDDLLGLQPTAQEPVDSCGLSTGACTTVNQLVPVTTSPPELLGNRALLSELDLGDIGNYEFPAADLVNAAGQAVGPTKTSVEAAVKDMTTNPDGITQYYNFSNTDPKAYPLAMVEYAMVPTCGLSSTEASAISDFLTKAATTGQVQGDEPGQLGQGYYPLNAKQKAQTLLAAKEVKEQDCKSLPPDKTVDGRTHVDDTTTPNNNTAGTNSGPSNGATPTTGASSKASGKSASPSTKANPSSAPTGKAQTAAFGEKSADSGMAGILLLIAIIAGAVLLIGGPTAWVLTVTGKWPAVLRWLRPVQSRLRMARAWLAGLAARRA